MNDSFDIRPLKIKHYLLALLIGLPLILIFALPEILSKTYFKLKEINIPIILLLVSVLLVFYLIFILASFVSARLRRYRIENNTIVISSFLSKKTVIPFKEIKNVSFIASKDSIDPYTIVFYTKDDLKLFSFSKDDYLNVDIVKLLELLKEQKVEMSDQIETFIRRSNLGL